MIFLNYIKTLKKQIQYKQINKTSKTKNKNKNLDILKSY